MQNNLIILKVIFILMIFSGCAKPQPRNESQEKIEHGSEDGRDDRNTSIQTYPRNQIDSLKAIIPQETYLFQLFKKGFKEFRLPIQGNNSGYSGWGFFPEIFNGYKHLINSNDTIPFSVESDSIFWANIYEISGIVAHPLKSIKCIEKSNLEDSDLWFKLLKDGEIDSLKDLLREREEECFPSSYIYLGLMVIKNDKVIKIDTIHYGELDSGYNCGKDGSFFEIPDSIFELYCKKPQ